MPAVLFFGIGQRVCIFVDSTFVDGDTPRFSLTSLVFIVVKALLNILNKHLFHLGTLKGS